MTKVITKHKYVDLNLIDKESTTLVLGTIHPHRTEDFVVDFFYGNRASIWGLLNKAFPLELTDPYSKISIISFLKNRRISISDTILECQRKSNSSLDSDLEVIRRNDNLIEQIKNSAIEKIFFTSKFGKNNAFKIFYVDILQRRITKEIRKNGFVELDSSVFGRKVILHCLPSPSGAANISLSKSPGFLSLKETFKSNAPVNEYKVMLYKEFFRDS